MPFSCWLGIVIEKLEKHPREKIFITEMSAGVRELLNAKLDVLPANLKDGKVITVDKNATLPQVLDLLSKHDINSN